MAQAETVLITPRRNFLVRALGFTAAGAAMSIPIVTVADTKSKIEHHAKALRAALADHYPDLSVNLHCDLMAPDAISACRSRGYIQFVVVPFPVTNSQSAVFETNRCSPADWSV